MALTAGSKLGPYEILCRIGAGGMGEVYRARDERLKREVAIKVLPASFSSDAERLRRFEQEAQAAGALNHPNILAIYDVGAFEGEPYVVSELLEGETLGSRLSLGALTQRKAVDYSVQIAQGLAAAHEKGIVHRDLKPENIFVTKDGRVKILDFGLAKLTQPEGEGAELTSLPTATKGTEPGVVLGTLGYMSPEQVRGRPADARSDIFSFGAVLYEMLSGKRAFHGESAADTISAILTKEPADLSETNRNISPGLERVVRHCLEKNPEERFHSAHDLAFDLQALSGDSAATGTRAVAAGGGGLSGRKLSLPLAAGLAVVALAVGAMGSWLLLRKSAAEPPRFTKLTFRRGLVQSARFAPDGETILYGAAWDGAPFEVFTTRPKGAESRPLGVGSADLLAISRTGELAISQNRHFTLGWENSGTLARVPLSGGGAPRELLENVQEAGWSPDGQELFVVRDTGSKCRIEFPIGKALYETTGWISLARLSPKGDRIAFVDHPQRGDNIGSLCTVDLSGRKTVLTPGTAQGLAWSPDGSEVWASFGGTIAAVPRPEVRRTLARLPGTAWLLDVSPAGKALVAHSSTRREMVGLAPGESTERNLTWFDWSVPNDLTSDGRTVLFHEANRRGEKGYAIFIRKTDGSAAVRLGEGAGLAFSPDARLALSVLHPFGQTQLELLPTGAGQARQLPQDAIKYAGQGAFLPDGNRVVVAGTQEGHAARLYVRDLTGGAARPITPEGIRVSFNSVNLSPDGKLAAAVDAGNRARIYPVDGGQDQPIPGVEAGELPIQWSTNTSLFVSRPSDLPAKVFRIDVATGRRELVRQLTPLDPAGVFSIDPILMTRDGKAYVYSYRRHLSELYFVEGLK